MSVLREGSGMRWLALAAGALFVSIIALAAWFAVTTVTSRAVHNDHLFELGGNIVDDGNPANGPDWSAIFDANGDVVNLFGGVDAAFLLDDLSQGNLTDDTIFAGSNKNNDLISTWNWDTGNNPPKDDLSNVYVWATRDPSGNLVLYVGLERLAPEGASHVDVQFYSQSVGLDKDPACGSDGTGGAGDGAPCEFTGEKIDGDLMVSMDFENGGALGKVRIFAWNATTNQYDLVTDVAGQGCNAADTICGFNNTNAINGGPWPSYDRFGNTIASLPSNAFTEVGVNVSEILGAACINTVMGATRSSPPGQDPENINSELKDFTPPHSFQVCDLEVEKTGSEISKVGDPAAYEITISNTGALDLYKQSIIDSLVGDLTDGTNPAIVSSDCGAVLPADSSCTITLAYTVQPGDPDPLLNTVDVVYDSQANLQGAEFSESSSHEVNLFQPGITVDKSADADIAHIGDDVNYTFTVTNTSSLDSPDLDLVSITDDVLGDLTDGGNPFVTSSTCTSTLAVGASCSITATRAVEAGDPDPLTNTVEVHYNPENFPNDITDSASDSVDIIHPAIAVVKECSEIAHEGETITVTATVTNPGDVPLGGVTATDDIGGPLALQSGDTNTDGLLDPGETWIFTGSYLAPAGTSSTDTVTVEGTDPLQLVVQDSDQCVTTILNPDITVVKECTALVHEGDTIDVTATVTNTGDTPLHDIVVTDSDAGALTLQSGDTNANNLLDLTETWVFTGSYTAPSGTSATDTVTAVGLNSGNFQVQDTDQCTTTIIHPAIAVAKECTDLVHEGDAIDVTATVTNSGDVPLGSVTVSDSDAGALALQSGDTNTDSLLDTDETWVFTGSYTAPAGTSATDTVTAEGTDPLQLTVQDSDQCTTTIIHPAIAVAKQCTGLAHEGDTIDLTATVTNPGDVSLGSVSVSDSDAGALTFQSGDTNADSLLDTSETWVFTGSYTAPAGTSATDTVTAEGTDPLQLTVQDSDQCTTTIINPGIAVVKECTGLVHEGEPIDVMAAVSNTGDTPLGSVTATDSEAGPLTFQSGDTNANNLLDTSETWIFTGSYTAPVGNVSSDTVTAQGFDELQLAVQHTDGCLTTIIHPAIAVSKQCTGLVHEGDSIDVTATVTNTGDVPLGSVTVSDSDAGALAFQSGDTNTDSLLDTDETWVFVGSYTAPAGTSSTDTVTAEGTDEIGLTVQDTDQCTTVIINPGIAVVKECTGLVHEGDTINVTATVTNTGDVELGSVTVTDSDAGALTFQSGDTNANSLLDTSETWVFTGSYAAPAGTSSTDTVTAEGTDPLDLTVQDADQCTTTIIHPAIAVAKECTSPVHPGELINLIVTVTNPGDTPLGDVIATDSHAGTLTFVSGDTNADDLLDTDETWTYTGSHVAPVAFSVTDTVTVQGTDVIGMDVNANDSCVTVIDQLPEVEVDKTADGTDADSDFTDDETTAIGSTVTYRVVIDNDSPEAVTITSLLDDTYPGITCLDSNGDNVVGQTLEADDGDGPGSMNGGPDEITCTFQAQAPSSGNTAVTDVVTVTVADPEQNVATDNDDATITTLPQAVLAAPKALPKTGGISALARDTSNLILFALIGLTLVGGSAWILWSNRRWDNRRGSRF